jgi:hypothetical protein
MIANLNAMERRESSPVIRMFAEETKRRASSPVVIYERNAAETLAAYSPCAIA